MQVYKYDEKTKEYIGTEIAIVDPLESKLQGKEIYLLPANTTFVEPTEKEGYANVWNGEAWDLLEDNRNKEYWLATDEYGTPARKMDELGALPENVVFEAPKQTVEEVRLEKLAELKNIRDTLEVEPIEYEYHFFDYDEKARDRISVAIPALDAQTALAGETATIEWTTADNEDATVTANDLRGVIANVAARSNLLHVRYRQLKELVNSLEDIDKIKEVEWDRA